MKNRDRIHLYHSEDDMDKSSLGAYEQKLKCFCMNGKVTL